MTCVTQIIDGVEFIPTPAGANGFTDEAFLGSDATLTDGVVNRVLTTASVSSAIGAIVVYVAAQFYRLTLDYTISGDDITFLGEIFDESSINVVYAT